MAEKANVSNSAQNITTPPEENGAQGNKLFTQEEVNKIVSERLNRERAKAEPSETEARELELAKRESRFHCREFLSENHYSDKLLDILDTSDAERFKETVKKLTEVFENIQTNLPRFGGNIGSVNADPIADAFKPKL